jgi:hypothetical protein
VKSACCNNQLLCVKCHVNKALAKCDDCVGNGYYCMSCIEESHNNVNITHTPLVWKEDEHRFIALNVMPTISVPHSCKCNTSTYFHELMCSDVTGIIWC